MNAPEIDLAIHKGKTFEYALMYAEGKTVSKAITAVPSVVPVQITVPSHGMPDGWPFSVACVRKPAEMNGNYTATFVDEDTVEINGLVGQCWRHPWVSGGVIQYPAPADITGWTARAMFRRNIRDPEPVLSFTTEPGADGLFLVDPEASTFTMVLEASVSEDLPLMHGVWDAEAIDPSGRVYPLVAVSPFCFKGEVTR